MLRSDSTALFERLREANILLQEVLSGAQENMSSIERTMVARVSEFVAAMTDLTSKSGDHHRPRWSSTSAVQQYDRQGAAGPRRPGGPVQHPRPLARRRGGAARHQQPPDRRIGREPASHHRGAGLDARLPHRRFRAAAAALLRPARRIARCRDGAGAGDRQHRRRDQQRKRADDRAAIRTGAQDLGGRAQAHQRDVQRGLRRSRRRRCRRCSTNPPSASPRSCRA